MQYLYRDGTDYVFMDNVSYDQVQVTPEPLGDAAQYVKEGDSAVLQMYDEEIVGVDLPASVELTVTETEPGRPGRPGLRCPQTGHARDRARGPGAAVRQPGRTHQGRYPHRRVHHPGLARRPDVRVHGPCPGHAAEKGLGTRRATRRRPPLRGGDEASGAARGPGRHCPSPPTRSRSALVTGVAADAERIDELMASAALGWDVERMPVVDRTHPPAGHLGAPGRPDVPVAVVIDEAVELAKQYSTE